MIVRVQEKRDLKRFIYFVKDLYGKEENCVFPFFSVQKKELTRLVLREKSYFALLCIEKKRVLGRILYTFQTDSHGKRKCYFSFFDFYNDLTVAQALTEEMQQHANKIGYGFLEGPYCPYDPDTRRGVLTNCFDKLPSVFLTYNFPYYTEIYEKLGFYKMKDTLSVTVPINDGVYKKADAVGRFLKKEQIEISYLNRKQIDKEIQALVDIMAEASTEINYTSPPSYEMIESIFKSMRFFLKDEYIVIARERGSERAVGFVVCIPELNQAFVRLRGRMNPFRYLFYKKSINKVRGWLQYVIPEYQKTYVLGALFCSVAQSLKKDRIIEFEGGTIVEDNRDSYTVFRHFGGYTDKIYRIYGKGEVL